jgi:transcriptional regulator with XRE-family HTH domain
MPRKTLPKALKKRRAELNRSLRRAAEISGLSNPRLCQLENDTEVSFLTMSWLTLQRVCLAYDVPFTALHEKLQSIARQRKVL